MSLSSKGQAYEIYKVSYYSNGYNDTTFVRNDSVFNRVPGGGYQFNYKRPFKTFVTTSQITGFENVSNTSDLSKPISTATQTALNTKMNIWFAADAQASDSYVITLSPVPASYTTGMMIVFKANTANTTGCTINVNGLGAKDITKRVSTALSTGDILQNMLCWLVYDGTRFIILNPVVN